jgi:hypothetical protein
MVIETIAIVMAMSNWFLNLAHRVKMQFTQPAR